MEKILRAVDSFGKKPFSTDPTVQLRMVQCFENVLHIIGTCSENDTTRPILSSILPSIQDLINRNLDNFEEGVSNNVLLIARMWVNVLGSADDSPLFPHGKFTF